MNTELYTGAGWPSDRKNALKTLAGKVSTEYDFTFDNDDDDDDDDKEQQEHTRYSLSL